MHHATLILAYDSKYIRQMCDQPSTAPPPDVNTTVVTLCRRLLEDATACGLTVVWVKVRGHSQAVKGVLDRRDQEHLTDAAFATVLGNDWADWAATQGRDGRCNREEDVRAYLATYVE